MCWVLNPNTLDVHARCHWTLTCPDALLQGHPHLASQVAREGSERPGVRPGPATLTHKHTHAHVHLATNQEFGPPLSPAPGPGQLGTVLSLHTHHLDSAVDSVSPPPSFSGPGPSGLQSSPRVATQNTGMLYLPHSGRFPWEEVCVQGWEAGG